jgi:hypothetical protein
MTKVISVVVDKSAYDDRQRALLRHIAEDVRQRLTQWGAYSDDRLDDLLFRLTAIIDGSRVMEHEGKPLIPFLTFAEERSPSQIISFGGTSFMHEYSVDVAEWLDEEPS